MIELVNKYSNIKRTVKIGYALYLLIPTVYIFIAIERKQFKMATLNTSILLMIIQIIMFPVLFIFGGIIGALLESAFSGMYIDSESLLLGLFAFWIMIYLISIPSLYIFVKQILDLNKWTLKWYLENGYEVINSTPEIDKYVEDVKKMKYPVWLLIK